MTESQRTASKTDLSCGHLTTVQAQRLLPPQTNWDRRMGFTLHAVHSGIRAMHAAATCHLRAWGAFLDDFIAALLLGALGMSVPALTSAQAKEAQREPFQYSARDLEVRLDSLPDSIPSEQIEIVLEASDIRCKPGHAKFLGMNIPIVVPAAMANFCRQVDTYLGAHKGPIPLQLSRKDWTHRKLAAQVQELDVSLGRRYVLLSRWRYYDAVGDASNAVRSVRWIAEEALWDREERKALWHSLQNIYCDDHYGRCPAPC